MAWVRIGRDAGMYVVENRPGAAQSLAEVIEGAISGSVYGALWPMAVVVATSDVDWPIWQAHHSTVRMAYEEALGDKPMYRDFNEGTERERKAAYNARMDIALGLRRSHYIPPDVWLVEFLEGRFAKVDLSRFGDDWIQPCNVLETLLLKAYGSREVFRPEESNFTAEELESFRLFDTVHVGDDITVPAKVRAMSGPELRKALVRLGIKPVPTAHGNRVLLLAAVDAQPEDVGALLDAARDWLPFWQIATPPGYEWADFQSWRHQMRGIAETIFDLYRGAVNPDLTPRRRR